MARRRNRKSHEKSLVVVGYVTVFAILTISWAVAATARKADAGSLSASSQLDLFQKELELAEAATDRDTRVQHLQTALAHRPNDPENIVIECRIAAELSQRYDPEHPTPFRREEALKVIEGIVKRYEHMDYYSPRPVNSSNSMQLMMPQAAIWGACLERGLNRNNQKAREYTLFAMRCLTDTYERRMGDWSHEPPPPRPSLDDPVRGGEMGTRKWKARMDRWQERQQSAAKGEVFRRLEMSAVTAAVRQHGYTYGRQQPHEVPIAMGEIVRAFPGTPMAKVAQEHMDRAGKMAFEGMGEDILESFDDVELLDPKLTVDEVLVPEKQSIELISDESVSAGAQAREQTQVDEASETRAVWPLVLAALLVLGTFAAVLLRKRRRAAK